MAVTGTFTKYVQVQVLACLILSFLVQLELGCPRMKGGSSISVPIVDAGNTIVQAFKDMIDMKTFTWDSVILLHDMSVNEMTLVKLINTIREIASVATFDMGSQPSESISAILADLPARQLGYKFMVLTKQESVSSINAAVS